MEKARMYVFIIIKAICFYAKKHMYITGALAAVTIRSLWGAVSTQNTFWLVCPIATDIYIESLMNSHHREFRESMRDGK